MMTSAILINAVQQARKENYNETEELAKVKHFHRNTLPGYRCTPLIEIKSTPFAGRILVKDESNRFGLPAFKVLGGSYAAFVELCQLWQLEQHQTSLADLVHYGRKASVRPLFVTATDGNHGRGLAWFARQVQLPCRIFVPESVSSTSIANIASEGAHVEQLPCDYDATVEHAKRFSAGHDGAALLVQDTAWQGYERIPRTIVQGYSTLMHEIVQECAPTHVICPVGVGSLADAVVRSCPTSTKVISVEPVVAACLFKSINQGRITPIKTGNTIMPGLNCGTVSLDAWPTLRQGITACVTVTDEQAVQALKELQDVNKLDVGPCGAAALAALHVILRDRSAQDALAFDHKSVVVLLSTEGSKAAT